MSIFGMFKSKPAKEKEIKISPQYMMNIFYKVYKKNGGNENFEGWKQLLKDKYLNGDK